MNVGLRFGASILAGLLAGCDGEALVPDAGGSVDAGVEADAGPWTNEGCEAPENVVETGVTLGLEVDLSQVAARQYAFTEQITLRPRAAGESITLFGFALPIGRASHGFRYDGQRATFCTGPFAANEAITVEIDYLVSEEVQMFPAGALAGMEVWGDTGGDFAVGPYSSPFFATTWMYLPQTMPWIDAAHAGNVAIDGATLTVRAPDETWTVMGPGAPAIDGSTWSFALDGVSPAYALSFAASPSYELIELPAGAAGVSIRAGVFASQVDAARGHVAAAGAAVDFLSVALGPFAWGDTLGFAEVPGYPGGFEHTNAVWLGSTTIDGTQLGDYVAVHEAAHHWWGNDVRVAGWDHIWLSEAFADWTTVFEVLPAIGDPDAAATLIQTYRDSAASSSYPARGGEPVGPLYFEGGDITTTFVANPLFFYRYGAVFLEMLDRRLERSFGTTLMALLQGWYTAHRGEAVTTEELLAFLIEETGESATWTRLFDDWVRQTPCPTLEASEYAYAGGRASLTLDRVDGADLDLSELEVAFVDGAGAVVTETVALPTGGTRVEVMSPVASEPTAVVVDPDGLYILRLRTAGGWAGPAVSNDLPD